MLAAQLEKYDSNCEAFRNFDDALSNQATKRIYRYNLNKLLDFGNLKGYDDLVKLDNEQIHDLLKNWIRELKNRQLKYKSAKTKLNAAELFFEMNKRLLYKKILHKMLPDSDEIPNGDVPFTKDDLQRLLQAAKKPRDIAMIHFFASTGIRPGSLLDPVLRLKHVEDMPNGCKVVKVYDNSKEGYWAFLTPEASKALVNYLNWRKRNGEELTPDSALFKNYKNPNTKNEHLSDNSTRQILDNLMKLAGIERIKTKNRFDKAIVYGFRKRFNTILKLENDVNSNIAEKLMGHKKGLDGSYLKPTREQCFKDFEKAIPSLTISDEERLRIENQLKQQEIDDIKKKNLQIEELEKRIDELENGPTARWNDYHKQMFNYADKPASKILLTTSKLLFEMGVPEKEKRILWKKLQDDKNYKTIETQEIVDLKHCT